MAAPVQSEKLRSTLDVDDLTDCKTVGTGVGVVSSGLTVGIGLCTGNIPMVAMGAISYFSGSLGHQHARELAERKEFRDIALSYREDCRELKQQVTEKDTLIKEQKGEIEKLQKINIDLQEKMQQFEAAQKSFDKLNEEQLAILQQQQGEIENRSCFLSRLSGTIEGYEQRKEKLREEIKLAREERERLQLEIKLLLEEQRVLNTQLASTIGSLDTVVDKMNQGKEEV